MNFSFLRQEGLELLEKLAGGQWTDFNAHDPGITILEQLCYALTDLGYRTSFEIPDLLADGGADPYENLHSPEEILGCRPVTPIDLRKLVLDVKGVKNAWIEPLAQDTRSMYWHPDTNALGPTGEPSPSEPVMLRGLYRVLVEPDLAACDVDVTRANVARRLYGNRGLCEDFAEIVMLGIQWVRVAATVEVAPGVGLGRLHRDVVDTIADQISPSIPFRSLSEMIDGGASTSDIFDGPSLENGFVRDEDLEGATRQSAIHTSDLVRALMDIEGVRAVSHVQISARDAKPQSWWLTIEPNMAPRLERATITLTREGKAIPIDVTDEKPTTTEKKSRGGERLPLPSGRDRSVGKYTSVQRHFPAIYGIGELGLPDRAPPERKARAKQLAAYLMFFDQLMADYLAQLAHVKDLFAFQAIDAPTYFTQATFDPALGLEALRVPGKQHLPVDDADRRRRFLTHLLARFGEALDVHRGSPELLRRYPWLSGARGTAGDELEAAAEARRSALSERLRLELGLTEQQTFVMIEHVLLRPMEGDDSQKVPWLAGMSRRDPYSLQLSFVLPKDFGDHVSVERAIRAATPAHLVPVVHWLDPEAWTVFGGAYEEWSTSRRAYLAEKVGGVIVSNPIALRSARDRLVDLLGIGKTYPLQDLPVRGEGLTVDYGKSSKFTIVPGQGDVEYVLVELVPGVGEVEVSKPVRGTGDAAGTVLVGPEILMDKTFLVRATKVMHPEYKAYLFEPAVVKVGINTKLQAKILGELLKPGPNDPPDTAPRITDHSKSVPVQIQGTQKGALYRLEYVERGGALVVTDYAPGTGGSLTLETTPLDEDTTIRIRATREIPGVQTLDELLEVKLPLAVRANRGCSVSMSPQPFADPETPVVVTISGSQESVTYNVYVRTLADDEFDLEAPFGDDMHTISVPGVLDIPARNIGVRRPVRHSIWQDPEGYVQRGPSVQGNGADLQVPIGVLQEDSVLLVRAHKVHRSEGMQGESAVQLDLATFVLVRPKAPHDLALIVTPNDDRTGGAMLVTGGQRGVFYHFRGPEDEDRPIGLPAYFHRVMDRQDPPLNRGIELLEIGRDFVVTRDRPLLSEEPEDLARTPPLDPVVDITPLPPDGTIRVWAIHSRTGVAWASPMDLTVGWTR